MRCVCGMDSKKTIMRIDVCDDRHSTIIKPIANIITRARRTMAAVRSTRGIVPRRELDGALIYGRQWLARAEYNGR